MDFDPTTPDLTGEAGIVTGETAPSPPTAQPVEPAASQAGPKTGTPASTRHGGVRRIAVTLALAGALLAIGGVSAVAAASPSPSATTTPSTQHQAGSGATTAHGNCPAHDGTTKPSASPTN